MIFLTVGTQFPFDRLVMAIDELVDQGKLEGDFFAQVGKGGYIPAHFRSAETLEKKLFDQYFEKADAIISHAGMGTITTALAQHKPIMVIPRLKKYNEVVNDHQNATAKRFEDLGHVIAAYNTSELLEKIKSIKNFKPVPRKSQAEDVSKRIGDFLHQC